MKHDLSKTKTAPSWGELLGAAQGRCQQIDAERAMQQTELAQKVLEHQPSAILVLSQSRVIKLLNPAAEALFGVSRHRVLGTSLQALFHNSETLLSVLKDSANGQSATLHQQNLHLRGGDTLVVDLTCAPIGNSGDLLIQANPLSALRRINRNHQLINIEEASASLVRGLAHEIKNPLGGIRGAAQLLGHELEKPELGEYTGVIIRECDRLTALVDNILGPSKPMNLAEVNVHQVLEHVAQVAVDNVAAVKVRLVRDYDPSLPPVEADEDLLIQALLNIVSNACTALEGAADAVIRFTTRALRQFIIHGRRHRLVVCIDVEDNGPGIPEGLLDRMFYPMISGRPSGTGLGLAIAQTIARRHQGIIECDSRPSKTVFSLILPLIHEEEVGK